MSVPMSIAALVLFVVIWLLGMALLVNITFTGSDGGLAIGLAFVVGGTIGAIAAIVELIRSAIGADRSTRSRGLDT